MSQSPLSMEHMFRKIEALEAALAFTIASISVHMPAVKSDVIGGLKLNASRADNPESAKQALMALSELVERVQALPADEFQKMNQSQQPE